MDFPGILDVVQKQFLSDPADKRSKIGFSSGKVPIIPDCCDSLVIHTRLQQTGSESLSFQCTLGYRARCELELRLGRGVPQPQGHSLPGEPQPSMEVSSVWHPRCFMGQKADRHWSFCSFFAAESPLICKAGQAVEALHIPAMHLALTDTSNERKLPHRCVRSGRNHFGIMEELGGAKSVCIIIWLFGKGLCWLHESYWRA